MARVQGTTDGAEFGDLLYWSTTAGSVSAQSSIVASGNYAYAMTGTNTNCAKSIPDSSEYYFRLRWRAAASNSYAITWRKGATVLGSIMIENVTGKWQIKVGSTVMVTSNTVYTNGTWILVEVHVKIADSGGIIELKLDGTADISYSGDTKPGTETTIDNFYMQYLFNNIYFDDLAINDVSGSVDNSWCGDGRVILLKPNGNGDVSQLVGSDGNSVDNYALVDEIPSNGDTDYVASATVDEYDLYALENPSLSNVTILRAWVESRSRDTVAAGGKVAHVIKTGGTEYNSGDINLLTTYTACRADEYKTNPNTAAAWTLADLNNLQAGPKVR
jgi:hypothetical protein